MNAGIKLEDEERIRAEVAQKSVYVVVDSHQNCDDRKQSGNPNHHAEYGQKRPHFVLMQRRQSHASVFAQRYSHFGFSPARSLCAALRWVATSPLFAPDTHRKISPPPPR